VSAHDIRIHAAGREVIVTCEACKDEIGSSLRVMRLDSLASVVAEHVLATRDSITATAERPVGPTQNGSSREVAE